VKLSIIKVIPDDAFECIDCSSSPSSIELSMESESEVDLQVLAL